jgi:hypothetical protein
VAQAPYFLEDPLYLPLVRHVQRRRVAIRSRAARRLRTHAVRPDARAARGPPHSSHRQADRRPRRPTVSTVSATTQHSPAELSHGHKNEPHTAQRSTLPARAPRGGRRPVSLLIRPFRLRGVKPQCMGLYERWPHKLSPVVVAGMTGEVDSTAAMRQRYVQTES